MYFDRDPSRTIPNRNSILRASTYILSQVCISQWKSICLYNTRWLGFLQTPHPLDPSMDWVPFWKPRALETDLNQIETWPNNHLIASVYFLTMKLKLSELWAIKHLIIGWLVPIIYLPILLVSSSQVCLLYFDVLVCKLIGKVYRKANVPMWSWSWSLSGSPKWFPCQWQLCCLSSCSLCCKWSLQTTLPRHISM